MKTRLIAGAVALVVSFSADGPMPLVL